jgi:hypothetical protein
MEVIENTAGMKNNVIVYFDNPPISTEQLGCGDSLSMKNAGSDYNRELDLILQELAADKELQEQTIQNKREAVWKMLDKIYKFTATGKSKNCTPAQMERLKQRMIDVWLSLDDEK